MARTLDLDALAAAAGLTRRTIERVRREGAPMPKAGEAIAAWLERFNQWREARQLAKKQQTRKLDADGRDWDAEGKKALALRRMHDLAVQRKEYMPRAEVVGEWARRVFTLRTRLLALPRLLGARCANQAPDLVEREAMQLVRQLLVEYSAEGDATPEPKT